MPCYQSLLENKAIHTETRQKIQDGNDQERVYFSKLNKNFLMNVSVSYQAFKILSNNKTEVNENRVSSNFLYTIKSFYF